MAVDMRRTYGNTDASTTKVSSCEGKAQTPGEGEPQVCVFVGGLCVWMGMCVCASVCTCWCVGGVYGCGKLCGCVSVRVCMLAWLCELGVHV